MATQALPPANGRAGSISHESNSSGDGKVKSKQQRRRPLQSRPLCTIVNGGIAVNKERALNKDSVSGEASEKGAAQNSRDRGTNAHVGSNAPLQTDEPAEQGNIINNSNNAKPPKRFVAPDELPAFCAAIEGSCLTKIALVEELKRK